MKKEITHLVNRVEILEESFGIEITGLYATCEYIQHMTPMFYMVTINYDVFLLDETKLPARFTIDANAYSADGQLLRKFPAPSLLREFFSTGVGFVSRRNQLVGYDQNKIFSGLDQEPDSIQLVPAIDTSVRKRRHMFEK